MALTAVAALVTMAIPLQASQRRILLPLRNVTFAIIHRDGGRSIILMLPIPITPVIIISVSRVLGVITTVKLLTMIFRNTSVSVLVVTRMIFDREAITMVAALELWKKTKVAVVEDVTESTIVIGIDEATKSKEKQPLSASITILQA